jgi:two-component system copper resistance phosphate regulon response regulator CusR
MESPANLCILVIEDDLRMLELLRTGLWERGHSIVTAMTAQEGQQLADENNFDAIVLDIGLPDRSGYTVAQHLMKRANRPAIVMLTALNQEDSVVSGLNAGADDYLTKPFSFPELAARIASAARRSRIAASDQFCFGLFRLNIESSRLFCDGMEVRLTRNEYLLLRALALNYGEVVPRRKLAQAVWGGTAVSHGALDTLINTLRDKLHGEQPGLISTIRGIGYSLVESAAPRSSTPAS